jgi:hypothetical protein
MPVAPVRYLELPLERLLSAATMQPVLTTSIIGKLNTLFSSQHNRCTQGARSLALMLLRCTDSQPR